MPYARFVAIAAGMGLVAVATLAGAVYNSTSEGASGQRVEWTSTAPGRYENTLAGGSNLSILPMRRTGADGIAAYYLFVRWTGNQYLFIARGPQLAVELEGRRYVLESKDGSNAAQSVQTHGFLQTTVDERALFEASADLLQRIAQSGPARFELYTQLGRFERRLDDRSHAVFKEFAGRIPAADRYKSLADGQ